MGQAMSETFPSFDVVINDKVVGWSPTKYLMLRSIGSNEACLGV
jgi:hypothetical protein